MSFEREILETLKNEVKVALGCTEPVAIALVVAHAAKALSTPIQEIRVGLCPNIYKNALNVGIPGTDLIGLDIAAALGANCDPTKGLTLLKTLTEEDIGLATAMIEKKQVHVYLMDVSDRIYLKAQVLSANGTALAEIRGTHDNLTLLTVNGVQQYQKEANIAQSQTSSVYDRPVMDIIHAVINMPSENLDFLLKGVEVNMAAAQLGLKKASGLGIGHKLMAAVSKGHLSLDLANETLMMTASASDARMSGDDVEIMTSNGSGNNGITAIIPLSVYAKRHTVTQEQLYRAIAISHLINGKIKKTIGRLSPMCACSVAAATGASVGLVYLMGGNASQMENSIQAMISNLSGMICDGAKTGCSLKLATSAATAVQSALFSIEGLVMTRGNGILGERADQTIENLGRIAHEGMAQMDQTILSILSD